MNGRIRRLALLACIAAWLPGVTSAAVLSDNLSNPADFSRPFSDTSWVAQEFATTATEFTVNSITVPLSRDVNATGTAQLSIFSSVSGLPGSSLGLFATTDIATQVTTASTNYTFSGSTVTLAPSTSYYLVLNALPGISGAVRWGGTFNTTGIGFPSAYSQNNFSGSSGLWTGRALTQPNRMRIEAVPEPSTCAMAFAGLACGGYSMWRRRKRAGRTPTNLISMRGEQVAIMGLLPSVFSGPRRLVTDCWRPGLEETLRRHQKTQLRGGRRAFRQPPVGAWEIWHAAHQLLIGSETVAAMRLTGLSLLP